MIVKRLAVWLIETTCEALLLSVFLIVLNGRSRERSFTDDLLLALVGTGFVFMWSTGYAPELVALFDLGTSTAG